MRYGKYFIKSGYQFFEYSDGHFAMTDRIPSGHRDIPEAIRSLAYAKTLVTNPEIVTLEIIAHPVSNDEIEAEIAKSVKKKIAETFTDAEKDYLRQAISYSISMD